MRRLLAGETSYERGVYVFLSTFRFFSFALATALMATIPKRPLIDWQTLLIISLVGFYTILRILFRFRLWQSDVMTYTMLGGDLVVCVALILLTGGADSPFLLYSLLPIMTAALFFDPKVALTIAGLSVLNLILAHTVLANINIGFAHILEGKYLALVVLYTVFSFIIATITYQANFNIYRHIQSEAIIEERRRLRREIHDNVAQTLGYLSLKTDLIKKSLPPSEEKLLAEIEDIHKTATESYQDIRDAIDSLEMKAMPFSLLASLSSQAQQFGEMTGIKTEFTAPKELPALHPQAQLQLLRIAQEALSNVRRHAAATQVSVKLENTPQGVELVVRDNGRGFSPSAPKGSGLEIMKERASSVKGILTVTSSPGQGTEVRAKVPRR